MLRPAVLTTSLLLACAATGCGSSGGAKADFVAKANRICDASNSDLNVISVKLHALGQTVRNQKNLYAQAATLTHQAAVRETRAADELAGLKAPGADRTSIDTWLGQLRRQASLTELAVGAFTARNPKVANDAVSQIRPLQSQAHAFANRYGMRSCGKTTKA